MATDFDRITVEPGLRLAVRRVLELLATYPDPESLFGEYPFLESEDLRQALLYVAATVDNKH